MKPCLRVRKAWENPIPGILTKTLNNANGPPTTQVTAGTPGSEHIVNLNLGNAQIIDNELVIHEGEILKGTWTAPIDLVVNGGRVSPGNSPGIQNVATFTQLSGETEFEIASAGGPGVGFDQINVAGLATMGGSARMRITLLGGYVPSVGQTFTIMTWSSHTGEFEITLAPRLLEMTAPLFPATMRAASCSRSWRHPPTIRCRRKLRI